MFDSTPPRPRGASSIPFLVSANLHAAVVFLLMSTLAPSQRPGALPVEVILGSPEDLEVAEDAPLTILPAEAFFLESTAAHDFARPSELLVPAPPSPATDQRAHQHASMLADAMPAIDSLFVINSARGGTFRGMRGGGVANEEPGKGGGGGEGGPQASFFGTTAYGSRFVYVLDMSGSMSEGGDRTDAGNRFRRAIEELMTSIERLTPQQTFYVYLFSHLTRPLFDEPPLAPRWRAATPENKQMLRAWLATIEPAGSTDPRTALLLGLSLRPDAVFLLSDGRFNGKEKELTGGLAKSQRRQARGTEAATARVPPIHSFAFEDTLACKSMQDLALRSGGIYRFVPPPTRAHGGKAAQLDAEILAENLLKTAESLERSGRPAEAWEKYRQVEQEFPETPHAYAAAQRAHALLEVEMTSAGTP